MLSGVAAVGLAVVSVVSEDWRGRRAAADAAGAAFYMSRSAPRVPLYLLTIMDHSIGSNSASRLVRALLRGAGQLRRGLPVGNADIAPTATATIGNRRPGS